MIWQNPWAWARPRRARAAGAHPPARPRARARRSRFPTLRFLARRGCCRRVARASTIWLLLVARLAILVAAVAALAQPLLLTRRSLANARARRSRARSSSTRARACASDIRRRYRLDAAMREARRLAGEAQTSVVLSSATPSRVIAAATAWLSRQAGRVELVVISDLQLGAVDRGSHGLRRAHRARGGRVGHVSWRRVSETATGQLVARATVSASRTDAQWTGHDRSSPTASWSSPRAADLRRERRGSRAPRRAAGARLPLDSARAIAIVFPRSEQRAALLRSSRDPARTMDDGRRRPDCVATRCSIAAADRRRHDERQRQRGRTRRRSRRRRHADRRRAAGRRWRARPSAPVRERRARQLSSPRRSSPLRPRARSAARTNRRARAGHAARERDRRVAARADADPTSPTAAASRDRMSDGRWLWVLVLALLALESVAASHARRGDPASRGA